MTRLDRIVDLIVNEMNKDIEYEEKRSDFKFDRTNMSDFLEEIKWGQTSKDFKEEVLWLANEYDNDLYKKGYNNNDCYILMMDDGSIESEGKLYTYRQIMSIVRKEVFKNSDEEEE